MKTYLRKCRKGIHDLIHNATYSFIVLVVISCLTAFLAVMVSLKAIHDNSHNFCDIVNSIEGNPVAAPPPNADPKIVRSYTIYREFVRLHDNLGC